MQKIEILVGIPGAGKSSYCNNLMKKEPGIWKRINNDSLRESFDFGVYDKKSEKLISDLRKHLISVFLQSGFNILIDNLNLNKRHWTDVSKICKEINKDIMLLEKHFYVELEEAIERDSKRIGKACVGSQVINKWWKESGGKSFKHYSPRKEIFKKNVNLNEEFVPMVQDKSLPKAAIYDNDGSISLLNGRSPYDASTCDEDLPHEHVIELMKLHYQTGHKIIFVSGREEKDRAPTERFYAKHFPEVKYELYMRPTGDMRKDVLIKEEIFNNHIKDKYYVSLWIDDRLQIINWLYKSGIPFARVNNPEATF